jgi:hypothetical protein
MNGFAEHSLDEGAFGEKTGNIVKAFDAFREYIPCPVCVLMGIFEQPMFFVSEKVHIYKTKLT